MERNNSRASRIYVGISKIKAGWFKTIQLFLKWLISGETGQRQTPDWRTEAFRRITFPETASRNRR